MSGTTWLFLPAIYMPRADEWMPTRFTLSSCGRVSTFLRLSYCSRKAEMQTWKGWTRWWQHRSRLDNSRVFGKDCLNGNMRRLSELNCVHNDTFFFFRLLRAQLWLHIPFDTKMLNKLLSLVWTNNVYREELWSKTWLKWKGIYTSNRF